MMKLPVWSNLAGSEHLMVDDPEIDRVKAVSVLIFPSNTVNAIIREYMFSHYGYLQSCFSRTLKSTASSPPLKLWEIKILGFCDSGFCESPYTGVQNHFVLIEEWVESTSFTIVSTRLFIDIFGAALCSFDCVSLLTTEVALSFLLFNKLSICVSHSKHLSQIDLTVFFWPATK